MKRQPSKCKQVFVVRKDLAMDAGKLGSQTAHAQHLAMLGDQRHQRHHRASEKIYECGGRAMTELGLDEDKTFYGHSHDFAYDLKAEEKLHDVERQLGIRSMLEHMKEAGWEAYQWRNSKEGRCSFIELSGMAYSDFKRTESTTGIRHAVEAMLNRVQAILRCEHKTGHNFKGRKGYDNGLLACSHCGFGGYAATFKRQAHDIEHWRMRAEQANARLAIVSARLGVHFNVSDQILLENKNVPEAGKNDGYAVIGDTDKVLFTIQRDPEGGS